MWDKNILILNNDPKEQDALAILCSRSGSVSCASNLDEAKALLVSTPFHVLIADHSQANYAPLKETIQDTTSVIITGEEERAIKDVASVWPLSIYVDIHVSPLFTENQKNFLRALASAVEHSDLKSQVEHLTKSVQRNEMKLKEAYTDIREIKDFINESVVKELEKRIAIEAKYVWFKKEKQKVERILKKLYMSNDVTQLLDVVYDVKEILNASGLSFYLLEESEPYGKLLKPLILDDSILSYPDLSEQAVLIDSEDFAASVARRGLGINAAEPFTDRMLARRYADQLKSPLKNILSVPIMHKNDVIGVLEVYNKTAGTESEKGGFTYEDQKMMERFAEHISIAIDKLNLIQYDALTGLLRPEPFFNTIIQKLHLERKRRGESTSFTIVIGDVDWFKNYNDRNGHQAGNILLRDLGGVLKSSVREEDLLCRYGGEEFLFFFSGVKNIHEAIAFTERIRKNVEEHYFNFQEYQPNQNLTMSFGLAFFSRERIDTWEDITKEELIKIINEADMALAEAKGKKSSIFGSPEGADARDTKNKVCLFGKDQIRESDKTDVIKKYMEKFVQERRRYKRHHIATMLLLKSEDHHKVTKTVNLSMGGAKISTDSKFDPHQDLDLTLILGNKVCQIKGTIVYSSIAEKARSGYHAGIMFRDVSTRDKKILQDYFASLHPRENSLPH